MVRRIINFGEFAWRRFENIGTVAVLSLMVALPVIEALLRKFFNTTLPGAAEYVRHGTAGRWWNRCGTVPFSHR